MRFEQLHLVAFGPFTGQKLDLSGGHPGGLHVVYGPNEAGKSTSLRAVTNFLFGIPRRSPDAHVHPSPKLAIEAEISEGERRYRLTRLKRTRDDLVFSDGTPVAESPIPELLGHLDEKSFSLRFGLDQAELEKGAEALLGGSEQGLFAAGTAGAEIRTVLDRLSAECEALYLPRGKVPLLNRRLAEFERVSREAKRAERPPEKWLEQERAYRKTSELVARLKVERQEVRSELRRLNRLKAVVSDLADFQRLEVRRRELLPIPELPSDSAEQREAASLSLSEARVESRTLEEEVHALEQELRALPPEDALAQVDDVQLELAARVGTALSARKDMPKRRAALLEVERALSVLLRDLGRNPPQERILAEARSLLVGEEVTGTVRRLLTERGSLQTQVVEAERRLRELALEHRELEQRSLQPPDATWMRRLEALVLEARAKVALEGDIERFEEEQKTTQFEIERLRQKWGTQKPCSELLPHLPGLEAARAAIDHFGKAEIEQQELIRKRARIVADLGDLEAKLEVKQAPDLPSEEKLRLVREQRDDRILQAFCDPTPELCDAARRFVSDADRVADRLRHEAERVAEIHTIEVQKGQHQKELARIDERLVHIAAVLDESREEFAALVERLGVSNAKGVAVSAQLAIDMAELTQRLIRSEDLQGRIASRRDRVQQSVRDLAEALDQPLGSSLSGVVSLAERRLVDAQKTLSRAVMVEEAKQKLGRAQDDALEHLDDARRQFQSWHVRWQDAVRPLGLAPETSAERAQEVLSTLDRIGRQVDQASQLEGRIAGMERDTDALARDIRRIAMVHLPALLEEDPVDAAVRLQEAIRGARRTSDERERVRRVLEDKREKLSQVRLRIETAAEKLEHLRALSGAESIADIPRVESASREKREVEARLAQLEQRIRVASDNTPISELLEEARPWQGSVGRLASEIDDLDVRNSELEQRIRETEGEAEGIRLGLGTYDSEDVAFSRQESSDQGAAVREALRAYLVRKAAQMLLQNQITQYAEKFRGPIAGHAGELFQRITLGKYTGLSIGVGDNTLRCVTEGREKELHELSRGTRAQLYFVLRMASLFAYFSEHPKVPLVFDDLFVDFDDDRTTAAFELLFEMAEVTQVLYFTHLARDVEKAHDAVPESRLFCHTIGV